MATKKASKPASRKAASKPKYSWKKTKAGCRCVRESTKFAKASKCKNLRKTVCGKPRKSTKSKTQANVSQYVPQSALPWARDPEMPMREGGWLMREPVLAPPPPSVDETPSLEPDTSSWDGLRMRLRRRRRW